MRNETTMGGVQLQGTPAGLIRSAVDSGAPIITGEVSLRSVSYLVIDQDEYQTTSTDFSPIPDVAVRFRVGGKRRSDVVATFSAMSFGGGLEVVHVRARLDKNTSSIPSEVQLSGADDAAAKTYIARCHSSSFVFQRVRPGLHKIAIDFRSFSGEPAFIHRPSLLVAHR
jgi:hypothetical protein